MGEGASLKRTLNGRPLVSGDVVSTSVYRQSPDMDKGLFPEEIFRTFFEQRAFGLHEIRLLVTATTPRGIVRVVPLAEDVSLEELARRTDGYTGADLENLVRKAGLHVLRSDKEINMVSMEFVDRALKETHRSVTPNIEDEYRRTADALRRDSFRATRKIGFATPAEGS